MAKMVTAETNLSWTEEAHASLYTEFIEQARRGATISWTIVLRTPANALARLARWVHCIAYKLGVRGWAPSWGKWADVKYELEGVLKLLEDGMIQFTPRPTMPETREP